MRYTPLLFALCLAGAAPVFAQSDDALYQNFGFNIGWNAASPQTTVFRSVKDRFDAEQGFQHRPMELGSLSTGGTLAFTYFGGNAYVDFEYRALGLTATYYAQPGNTPPEQEYKFKMYQHSGRFSYNYGKAFGRYGTSGIYLGGAVYGGTWGIKTKDPDDKKLQRTSIDDYQGFTVGVSPQLTARFYIVELKAYYDFPLLQTDVAPVYNKLFGGYGATDATGDASLKGRIGHAGVCLSVFIPFGKPSETNAGQSSRYRSSATGTDNSRQQAEREKSQERIRDMQRQQEREERRYNEKWNR